MDIKSIESLLDEAQVRAHPKFIEELLEIIQRTGQERKIIAQLLTRIMQIRELGIDLCKNKNFYPLAKYDNLYSMHLDTNNMNMRVLFSYDNKQQLWLHVFLEKQGKRVTKYESHAPIADERKQEMSAERRRILWKK